MSVTQFLRRIWQCVFPYVPQCVCCGVEKDVAGYMCTACAEKLGAVKAGELHPGAVCALSAYRYAAPASAIVKGFKYGDKKWLSAFMGSAICDAVFGPDWGTQIEGSKTEKTTEAGAGYGPYAVKDFDCICHVPLHKKRRTARGFDQAKELAAYMADVTGIPVCRCAEKGPGTRRRRPG